MPLDTSTVHIEKMNLRKSQTEKGIERKYQFKQYNHQDE